MIDYLLPFCYFKEIIFENFMSVLKFLLASFELFLEHSIVETFGLSKTRFQHTNLEQINKFLLPKITHPTKLPNNQLQNIQRTRKLNNFLRLLIIKHFFPSSRTKAQNIVIK